MIVDTYARLPRLVRLYIIQVLIGFAVSAAFVGILLYTDFAHLRSLMLSTRGGAIAGFLLFFFNGLVFAGVQFAITIMNMGESEDADPKGGKRQPVATAEPALVRIDSRR
ncbi:MAG: hypothetical protein R3D60_04085 [Paracoccaceae bacterium]